MFSGDFSMRNFFDGLSGITSIVSADEFTSEFWASVPFAAKVILSEGDVRSQIGRAFANGVSAVRTETQPANAIPDDAVISQLPSSYKTFSGSLRSVLAEMHGKGYWLVMEGAPAPTPATPPVASGGPGFWPGLVTQVTGGVMSAANAVPARRVAAGKTRYVTRTQKMSPADQNKLMWMLGIGGAVLAVAVGAFAARE